MEGSWLYAALALLNRKAADGQLSVWGLLLVYLIAFGSTKALHYLRWHRFFLGCISWLLWAAAMLLTVKIQLFSLVGLADQTWLMAIPQAFTQIFYGFKPELLILVSSGVLWWLGRRLAYFRVEFAAALAEFQFGLVILLIIFFSTSQFGLDQKDSVPTALVFFSFALLGISIAHAQESKSWLSGWYQGHWSGLLLVSIGLILVFGLLISIIITPDLLQLIIAGLKWLWRLVVKVLEFLASLLPKPEPAEPPPAMPMMPGGESPEQYKIFEIPEFLLSGLRLAWTIMVLGVVIIAVWRVSTQIFGWLRRRMASPGGEVESLSGAFKADFINWLKRILLKLLRIKVRLQAKKLVIPPEAATVRQIYSQLLHWAEAGGHPRRLSQTPDEYQYVLEGLLPETTTDLDFITRQYVGARYGPYLPTEDGLRQLKQSWHRLRQKRLKEPEESQPPQSS